jgi:Protein of unknown function (DUF1501)
MLTIHGPPRRLCSGPTRRAFLRAGALGCFGLTTPLVLRASHGSGPEGFGQAKRCLLLFLTGGPPQLDTFDMKPAAPEKVRGELKPIPTAVPGTQICELFPLLAQRTDQYCIVRSVTHGDRTHTSAGYTMLTGVAHPKANVESAAMIAPGPGDHPHIGALLAKVRPPGQAPTFASLPEVIKDAAINEFPGQTAGFLGKAYDPFRIEADPERTRLLLPDVFLPADVTAERLADRAALLGQLDRAADRLPASAFEGSDASAKKAFEVIRSAAVRRAFALDEESPKTRERYGRHLFGQGCLLARRLLEAGVGLVTVYWHYEGPEDSPVWDTHQNNFPHLRKRLMPPTDVAVSAVLDDLGARGMLSDTLVLMMGEFGRSPRINKDGGRDHWGLAQSILLAGAGMPAGAVYGATDRDGGTPAERPVSPADLTATLMHLLGIPADLEIVERAGRPIRACHGSVVRGLLT